MADRDTAFTIGELITLLERARDAGRDVGEAIRILSEMVTEYAGPAWCLCGHVEEAHQSHRRSTDCMLCACRKFQSGH